LKKLLIISPHFPPINAPDMHRIRISLPYYTKYGWEPTIVCVDEKYCEGYQDKKLNYSVSKSIEIIKVKAFAAKYTRKIGLGSLSLRSLLYYKRVVSGMLMLKKYDLILFSTSMFHVCSLGPYWKKRYAIPFVIDMQDPWRNDYYLNKPKEIRPPKYKIAYFINKQMEAHTIPLVDGIISVSQGILDELQKRYPVVANKPKKVIPFGYSEEDYHILEKYNIQSLLIDKNPNKINVVYMGALTRFFIPLIRAFFISLKEYSEELLNNYHFYFIGTNYSGTATTTYIRTLALELGLSENITEIPSRFPYYESLATLRESDILFIPGSVDADYNASKIYNNLFSGTPVFTIFNEKSLVIVAAKEIGSSVIVSVNEGDDEEKLKIKIRQALPSFVTMHGRKGTANKNNLVKYSANVLTGKQVELFDKVIK